MKTFVRKCALAVGIMFGASSCLAVVGYYNVAVQPGNNLVANQLMTTDYGINSLFGSQLPDGSTFTKWDPFSNSYLPPSTYYTETMWDIDYTLQLGEGGVVNVPAAGTITFVGEVYGGLSLIWPPPTRAPGIYLASYGIPKAPASFEEIIGRAPHDGESVTTLDRLTQVFSTTSFVDGFGWDNGTPGLMVGESAFFNLGPVPEPSSLALLGLGALIVASRRRKRP